MLTYGKLPRLQSATARRRRVALSAREGAPGFWSLRIYAYTGTQQSTIAAETATYGEPGVDGCDVPPRWFGHSLDTHGVLNARHVAGRRSKCAKSSSK